jgi:hypothetical protein
MKKVLRVAKQGKFSISSAALMFSMVSAGLIYALQQYT